jgi:hypothetical protein
MDPVPENHHQEDTMTSETHRPIAPAFGVDVVRIFPNASNHAVAPTVMWLGTDGWRYTATDTEEGYRVVIATEDDANLEASPRRFGPEELLRIVANGLIEP